MAISADGLVKKFKSEIIYGKQDTKNDRWKKIADALLPYVDKEFCKIQLFSPKLCIVATLRTKLEENPNTDILKTLDDIENAFYCLSQYALNLCREPQLKEYTILKTYTGYYTCNISSVLDGNDRPILESMGYTVRQYSENEDEFVLSDHVDQHIEDLAFQLFLSQPYCQKVKDICKSALDSDFNAKVVISVLERNPLLDMEANGIIKYCNYIKNLEIISDSKPVYKVQTPAIYGITDDVTDDDLYGPGSPVPNSETFSCNTQFSNPSYSDVTRDNRSHEDTTFNARTYYNKDHRPSLPYPLSSNTNYEFIARQQAPNATASEVTNYVTGSRYENMSHISPSNTRRADNKRQNQTASHVANDGCGSENMSGVSSELMSKYNLDTKYPNQYAVNQEDATKHEEVSIPNTRENVSPGIDRSTDGAYETVTRHTEHIKEPGRFYGSNHDYIHGTTNKGFTDETKNYTSMGPDPYKEGIKITFAKVSPTDDASAVVYPPSYNDSTNSPTVIPPSVQSRDLPSYTQSINANVGNNLYSPDESCINTNNARQYNTKSSPTNDASGNVYPYPPSYFDSTDTYGVIPSSDQNRSSSMNVNVNSIHRTNSDASKRSSSFSQYANPKLYSA